MYTRPISIGIAGASALLALYAIVVSLVSGFDFAIEQFANYWYFILALAIGFGVQVGLFAHLKRIAHDFRSKGVVAASGGTSAVAMISCCAHYLVNVAPIIAAAGIVSFIAQYQTEIFWVGLAFNLFGIVYITRKVALATEHMHT